VKRPSAPKHLALPTRRWWTSVVSTYVLEEHHARLLTCACEAWDRAAQAREVLARDGIVVADRYGGVRAHPAVAIERDARIVFARMVRELDLDGEPGPDPRLPRHLPNPNRRPGRR
jgi:P27 family predicted phage terminase small subunit